MVFKSLSTYFCFCFYYFFSSVQHGDQVTLTCIHFFPPFVLLRYEYLDIVLNATQQDLIVNPFQVASDISTYFWKKLGKYAKKENKKN